MSVVGLEAAWAAALARLPDGAEIVSLVQVERWARFVDREWRYVHWEAVAATSWMRFTGSGVTPIEAIASLVWQPVTAASAAS